MSPIHLNQRKCFFVFFFFSGERAEGGCCTVVPLPFPTFHKMTKWWYNNAWCTSFSLLIYRLNIHLSKKGRTLETQLLRFRGINHRDSLGAGFPEMSSIGLEITLACDVCPPVEAVPSVLRPWVAVAEQLVPHCSVWVWWTLRQEIIIAS